MLKLRSVPMHTIISDASKTCLQITPNYASVGGKMEDESEP